MNLLNKMNMKTYKTKNGYLGIYKRDVEINVVNNIYIHLFCSNDPDFSGCYDKYAKQFGYRYGFSMTFDELKINMITEIPNETFPKQMHVWSGKDPERAYSRLVVTDLGEHCDRRFVAVNDGEEARFNNGELWSPRFWPNASDVPKVYEFTLDEIAEKFGVPVSQLKIKIK